MIKSASHREPPSGVRAEAIYHREPESSASLFHGIRVAGFEVQPVRDHQLYVGSVCSADHRLAILRGDCHRLLAQNAQPRPGRAP